MPLSPPNFEDNFSYSDCDFMVYGHQINLPLQMAPLEYEEASMEFLWFETNNDLPDEVFLMPLNTLEANIINTTA